MNEMFYEKLENFGVPKRVSSWENINTAKKTEYLLKEAGFNSVKIEKAQHGYFLQNAESWWQVVMNAGMIQHSEGNNHDVRSLF